MASFAGKPIKACFSLVELICPNCGNYIEHLNDNVWKEADMSVVVKCEACQKSFIVNCTVDECETDRRKMAGELGI